LKQLELHSLRWFYLETFTIQVPHFAAWLVGCNALCSLETLVLHDLSSSAGSHRDLGPPLSRMVENAGASLKEIELWLDSTQVDFHANVSLHSVELQHFESNAAVLTILSITSPVVSTLKLISIQAVNERRDHDTLKSFLKFSTLSYLKPGNVKLHFVPSQQRTVSSSREERVAQFAEIQEKLNALIVQRQSVQAIHNNGPLDIKLGESISINYNPKRSWE